MPLLVHVLLSVCANINTHFLNYKTKIHPSLVGSYLYHLLELGLSDVNRSVGSFDICKAKQSCNTIAKESQLYIKG